MWHEWQTFESADPYSRDDVARRMSSRFELALVRNFVDAATYVGANVTRRRTSPDIVVALDPQSTPVGFEVKNWGTNPRSWTSRESSVLAQAVSARRAMAAEIALTLIAFLPPTGDFIYREEELLARMPRLLRGEDGVGFDRVFIGVSGPESRWFLVSSSGTEALDYEEVVDRALLDLATPAEATATVLSDLPVRALFVADEWSSSFGGISTFNRSMAIGLAAHGFEVGILLPSYSDAEAEEAAHHNITLYRTTEVPGLRRMEALLLPASYPDGYAPDLIVGHGYLLGPYALALQKTQFHKSKRLHVVHTAAEPLEAAKGSPGAAEMLVAQERRAVEFELAASSHLVAGVGPLLVDAIERQLRGEPAAPDVVEIVPELHNWGHLAEAPTKPGGGEVLLLGRADAFHSKGFDIAVRAVSLANGSLREAKLRPAAIVVRGVGTDDPDGVVRRLRSHATGVSVMPRPYTTVRAEVRHDIFGASAVLMPSRHEGFGLAAYEAIAAGVPVLVSEESGLGELIRAIDPAAAEVLPTTLSDSIVIEAWAAAVAKVVSDPATWFKRARDLRDEFQRRYSWQRVADAVRRSI